VWKRHACCGDKNLTIFAPSILSKLGFGVSGPHGTFLTSRDETISLIRRAHKFGIRNFDTAPSYGGGEAERRLGDALSSLECSDCIVSTKVGILSDGTTRKRRDFSASGVCSSVENSLRRLRRSCIDVLYLHGPAPQELDDELLASLLALKEGGQVGTLGVCGIGSELDAAISVGEFTHYMTPVNATLSSDALARLVRIRNAGKLVGIETMALTRKSMSPFSAGGVWRLARGVLRRARANAGATTTIGDAFAWSLKQGRADLVLTTTTSSRHLDQVIDLFASQMCSTRGPMGQS